MTGNDREEAADLGYEAGTIAALCAIIGESAHAQPGDADVGPAVLGIAKLARQLCTALLDMADPNAYPSPEVAA